MGSLSNTQENFIRPFIHIFFNVTYRINAYTKKYFDFISHEYSRIYISFSRNPEKNPLFSPKIELTYSEKFCEVSLFYTY